MNKSVLPFLLASLFLCLKLAAAPIPIPFQLAGNMIVIQASVNGTSGNFILDTGSPNVILNSTYFKGFADTYSDPEVTDIHGAVSTVLSYDIDQLLLTGTELPQQRALVLDLKQLEKARNMPILGIIGYSAISSFEIMFDFEHKQLFLSPLRKNGTYLDDTTATLLPSDTFDLKMCGHIPSVLVHLKGKTLRLGIDSGSEINILDATTLKKQKLTILATDSLLLRSISSQQLVVPVGSTSGLSINNWEPNKMRVIVVDLKYIRAQISPDLDGLLGTPFLQKEKIAINYKRKKLYLWREK